METKRDLALKRIEECRRTKSGFLNLRGLNLTEVPEVLYELEWLTSLDVSLNQIEDISILDKLTQLTYLFAAANQIEDISVLKKLTRLTSLNVNLNHIEDISVFTKLTKLTSLAAGFNRIKDISVLEKLTGLTYLDLWNPNPKRYLSNESFLDRDLSDRLAKPSSYLSSKERQDSIFHKYPSLHTLSFNQIENISVLDKLTNLTSLSLSGQIQDYSFIEKLTRLTYLDLKTSQIQDTSFLSKLTSLNSLNLGSTHIHNISFFENLTDLTSLDLSYNKIHDITVLEKLIRLTSLKLFRNQINAFPRFSLGLPFFRDMCLVANPILDIPFEIIEQINCFRDARNWFHDLEQGKQENHEVKIILIGNGRVGKTCILKRLVFGTYGKEEPSTHAINLERWEIEQPSLKRPDKKEKLTVNIWDFGGQDIYHATHRLFMQSRALYLLVWDWET
jgi:internalin A